MSTNCMRCVVNKRTGPDLLCDECRRARRSHAECGVCTADIDFDQVNAKRDGIYVCQSCVEAGELDVLAAQEEERELRAAPSIDQPLAAERVADLNEACVAAFEANARHLGLSADEEQQAYQVWSEIGEAMKTIIESCSVPRDSRARVAAQATYMTLRKLELMQQISQAYGGQGVAVVEEARGVLIARMFQRSAGGGL